MAFTTTTFPKAPVLTGKNLKLFLNGKEIPQWEPCSCPNYAVASSAAGTKAGRHLISVLHKLLLHKPHPSTHFHV